MSRNQPVQLRSSRNFDRCAYRSKDGKRACNSIRYYHNITGKGHQFVESSKLAIAIDATALETLMREYVDAQNGAQDKTLELERQLTLSGFLVWLKDKQKER